LSVGFPAVTGVVAALVRFANKATIADFVDAEDGFVLTEFFGRQAYHTAVVCVGRDPDQATGRLWTRISGN